MINKTLEELNGEYKQLLLMKEWLSIKLSQVNLELLTNQKNVDYILSEMSTLYND